MNKIYFLLVVLLTATISSGQIGVNTDNPNPNSLLHIETSLGQEKGIIIPRLTRDQINILTYVNFPTDLQIRLTEDDDGLKIYNLDDGYEMYWSSNEGRWINQYGDLNDARFTYTCSSVGVYGNYVVGKLTDESNYILLTVDVQKKGEYTIMVDPNISNGFSFVAQGFFNVLGPQTLKIPAHGTPASASPGTVQFEITSPQGKPDPSDSNCTFDVNIAIPEMPVIIADYNLNCSTIVVNGDYIKGTPLMAQNKIELTVNVGSIGFYSIYTESKNGIKFKAEGQFTTTGRQDVTLLGEGTPLLNEDFSLKIYSNSISSTVTCETKIPILLPSMTIGLIGNPDENEIDWVANENNRYKALTNSNNFGRNGKVRIANLDFKIFGSTTNRLNGDSMNQSILLGELNSMFNSLNMPDVIIYNSHGIPINSGIASVLTQYVNKGGILIFGTKDDQNTQANLLLEGVFGINNAVKQVSGDIAFSNVYPINSDSTDPIINGPFGNISGQNWGEEGGSKSSIVIPQLPSNSVQLVSAYNVSGKSNVDVNSSIVWYNKVKGFVYFGDSTSSTNVVSDTSESPSYYISNGEGIVPKPKTYGPGSINNRLAYNSILEMNAVAWALKKAASEGINYY